jgi:hypothetical protein
MITTYNPDLALYPPETPHKALGELLPSALVPGQSYSFIKAGHRNYLPEVPVTLLEIRKDEVLFDMKAQVYVTDSRFEMHEGKAYTAGTYVVRELLND